MFVFNEKIKFIPEDDNYILVLYIEYNCYKQKNLLLLLNDNKELKVLEDMFTINNTGNYESFWLGGRQLIIDPTKVKSSILSNERYNSLLELTNYIYDYDLPIKDTSTFGDDVYLVLTNNKKIYHFGYHGDGNEKYKELVELLIECLPMGIDGFT